MNVEHTHKKERSIVLFSNVLSIPVKLELLQIY
jgi:hypothetical protein